MEIENKELLQVGDVYTINGWIFSIKEAIHGSPDPIYVSSVRSKFTKLPYDDIKVHSFVELENFAKLHDAHQKWIVKEDKRRL